MWQLVPYPSGFLSNDTAACALSFDVNRTPGHLVITNVGLATDLMYIK